MSDPYLARITFPKKFLTDVIKKAILDEELEESYLMGDTTVSYEDEYATNGELLLEDVLIQNKIPFDRYSGPYYEIKEETRYYRPETETCPKIDETYEEDAGISYERLKEVLNNVPAKDLADYIKEELTTAGYYTDIPAIESYT